MRLLEDRSDDVSLGHARADPAAAFGRKVADLGTACAEDGDGRRIELVVWLRHKLDSLARLAKCNLEKPVAAILFLMKSTNDHKAHIRTGHGTRRK